MPKKKGKDILERKQTARPHWVKPRKQRSTPGRPCSQIHLRRRRDTPVTCLRDDSTEPPRLIFERERPECAWLVPAVDVPLYYFDETMLRKKLIVFHFPDTFTVTGSDRVFKLVARQQVHRTFWNRYLVYEVRADLPHNGCP